MQGLLGHYLMRILEERLQGEYSCSKECDQRWKELKTLYFSKKFPLFLLLLHIISKQQLCAGHKGKLLQGVSGCNSVSTCVPSHRAAIKNGEAGSCSNGRGTDSSRGVHPFTPLTEESNRRLCRLDSYEPDLGKETSVWSKEGYSLRKYKIRTRRKDWGQYADSSWLD